MTKLPPQRYKGEWRGPVSFACRVCGFKGCTRMEIQWRFTHLNIIRPAKEREDDDFFPLSPSNPLFLLLFASVPASGSKWEMKAKHETAPLPQCACYNMTLSRFLSKCARKKTAEPLTRNILGAVAVFKGASSLFTMHYILRNARRSIKNLSRYILRESRY